jgi:NitT/TauT family transport system substrate-binding protein
LSHLRLVLALLVALVTAATAGANAQETTLHFGYLSTIDQLPFVIAAQRGYFKKAGLTIDLVPFQTGPAVASAVAGGSVDFGYASTVPIIIARAADQPFRLFAATSWEQAPNQFTAFLVASAKSELTNVSGLAHKTLAVNAAGSGCDLVARAQLAYAHVNYDDVHIIAMPFPLMQAALQLGNIDAACVVDPFYTSIIADLPGSKVIGKSYLSNPTSKVAYPVTGLFARTEWLTTHAKEVAAMKAALTHAMHDIDADPKLARQLMVSEMHFDPKIAARVVLLHSRSLDIAPAQLQPVIDSLAAVKILAAPMKAEDVVSSAR